MRVGEKLQHDFTIVTKIGFKCS